MKLFLISLLVFSGSISFASAKKIEKPVRKTTCEAVTPAPTDIGGVHVIQGTSVTFNGACAPDGPAGWTPLPVSWKLMDGSDLEKDGDGNSHSGDMFGKTKTYWRQSGYTTTDGGGFSVIYNEYFTYSFGYIRQIHAQFTPGATCKKSADGNFEISLVATTDTNANDAGSTALISVAFLTSPLNSGASAFNSIGSDTFRATTNSPGIYHIRVSGYNRYGSGSDVTLIPATPVDLTATCDPKIDIYQVVKNPEIDGNSKVDLVAGKNADVVTTIGLDPLYPTDVDVANSTLTWGSHIYYPKTPTANNSGQVFFEINPVPATPEFLSDATDMHVTIKNSANVTIGEETKTVEVKKTKPIKLGFVPIFSHNIDYYPPSEDSITYTKDRGVELIQAMYPVAPADVSGVFSPRIMWGTGIREATELDRYDLAVMRRDKRRGFLNLGLSHMVGLVGDGYFSFHHRPDGTAGEAEADVKGFLVAAGRPRTIAHELGHVFCIRYDFNTGCKGAGQLNMHNLDYTPFTGYLNDDLPGIQYMARGFLPSRINLMVTTTPDGELGDRWLNNKEYETIFRNNLLGAYVQEIASNKLVIFGSINESGEFSRYSTRIGEPASSAEAVDDGEFLVEAKDINRNVVYSGRFNSQESIDSPGLSLEIGIPALSNIVFVDLYRDGLRVMRTGLDTVVVPSDIIENEIKYLPDQAFKNGRLNGLPKIATAISEYRNFLLNQKIDSAKDVLARKVFPVIDAELSDAFTPTSILDSGHKDVSELAQASLVRILSVEAPTQEPINPFVKLEMPSSPHPGERAALDVRILRGPQSSDLEMRQQIYFDGSLVSFTKHGRSLEAHPPSADAGTHAWVVRTFVGSARILQALDSKINEWNGTLFKLEGELNSIQDNQERQRIQAQILQLEEWISGGKNQIMSELKELGSPVQLQFEVQ